MNIIVKTTSWAGRVKNFVPMEEINQELVELGKKYIFNPKSAHNLSFEIIEVNDEYIKIKTDEPMSLGAGGINLFTDKKEFIIKINDTIVLKPPMLDSGYIYELTLAN